VRTALAVSTLLFLGASICASPLRADDRQPARPGTVNYVEGQVYLGTQTLDGSSIGKVEVDAGETLSTANGKAEMLLTPGVFVRLGDQSSATVISSGLMNTRVSVDQGEALVEVAEIHPENDLRILVEGKGTELLKTGLYDFDENHHAVRVLDGEAIVDDGDERIKVKSGRMVDLGLNGPVKTQKFNKKELEAQDLYRWTSLRSSYLAEANADAAPAYSMGFGWFGDGWYWNPWFDAYTFLPGDGIFYSPFGWGFYSPWCAGFAPFSYGGRYFHHFGNDYRGSGQQAHYGLPANYGRGVKYGPRSGTAGLAGGSRTGSLRSSGFHGGGSHIGAGGFGGGFHGGGGGFGGGGHR
jgi:hypothetical protein